MEKVECGLIADITNFLKTISDIAFKAFDRLYDMGVVTSDMEKTKDGGFKWVMSTKDKSHKIKCEAVPVFSKENTYDIIFENEHGKTYVIKNVSDKMFFDAFNEAVEVLFGSKIEDWVKASTQLKASFKRVVSDDEVSVELCGIDTKLPIKSVTDILGNALVDEFVATIPETETWFNITDNGDELDIQEIEPAATDIPTTLYQCLHAAFEALSTCQAVHWNARGDDFFTLHEKLDTYIEKLQDNIDELAELMKQNQCTVIAPAMIYKDIQPIDTTNGFDITTGFAAVKDVLTLYCLTLECYYANLGHGIQSEFDDILNYWTKEIDYKLTSLLN